VDWEALRAAIDRLRVRYDDVADGAGEEVRVQEIQNTEDGRIIIRVAVPEGGDKDADYRQLVEEQLQRQQHQPEIQARPRDPSHRHPARRR
jgi:hypothetical protein